MNITTPDNTPLEKAEAPTIPIANPGVLADLPDRTNERKGRAKYLYTSYTDETLSIVLEAAKRGDIVTDWGTISVLAHDAGIRASTTVRLEWEESVSFERKTIKFVERHVGELIPSEIPLNDRALSYLQWLRDDNPGERLLCPVLRNTTHLGDRWIPVRNRLGLARISLTSMCYPFRRQYEETSNLVKNIRTAIKLTRTWLGDTWVTFFLLNHAKTLLEAKGLDIENFGLYPIDANRQPGLNVSDVDVGNPENEDEKDEAA
jgi:hypothetical protein